MPRGWKMFGLVCLFFFFSTLINSLGNLEDGGPLTEGIQSPSSPIHILLLSVLPKIFKISCGEDIRTKKGQLVAWKQCKCGVFRIDIGFAIIQTQESSPGAGRAELHTPSAFLRGTIKSHSLKITTTGNKITAWRMQGEWNVLEECRAGSTAALAGGNVDGLRGFTGSWVLGQLQFHRGTGALPSAKPCPWCHQLEISVKFPIWINGFSSSGTLSNWLG